MMSVLSTKTKGIFPLKVKISIDSLQLLIAKIFTIIVLLLHFLLLGLIVTPKKIKFTFLFFFALSFMSLINAVIEKCVFSSSFIS